MEHRMSMMDEQAQSPSNNPRDQAAARANDVSAHLENMNARLSMAPSTRVITAVIGGLGTGIAAGFIKGFNAASLRFTAENAHRKPKSEKGWYFYHRSKQQYASLAGMKMGARLGILVSFGAGAFSVLEDQFDNMRGGEKDAISSILAGTVTAGLFSVMKKERWAATGRILTTGFKGGLAVGLLQDAVGLIKGQRIGYVEKIKVLLGFGGS